MAKARKGNDMHSITKISIKNFKSIKEATFMLDAYTPLVGYNNAGKTNLLKALQWIATKKTLSKDDFKDSSNPVEVSVTIIGITKKVLSGLNEGHQKKMMPLVKEDEVLKFKRTQKEPDNMKSLKLEVQKIDEQGKKIWGPIPAGIDQAISALFPEPIFIEAMKDAGEDTSKISAGSTIGKLLKEVTKPIKDKYAVKVQVSLSGIQQKLAAGSKNEKDEDLIDLDKRIQEQLSKLFRGIKAETHFSTPTIDDFFKSGTINITDETTSTSRTGRVSSFGHGTQRALQIALIKCLSDSKKKNGATTSGRTTLLLIDEPELYLHPQAIELVRGALSALAKEGGYQVIFTTHSPMMITRNDAPNTLIIQRDKEGTKALLTIKSAVKDHIENKKHQADLLFEIGNASEILFSEKVLFVEGKIERALLPSIYEKITGETLPQSKIGIVSLNGVGNLKGAMDILKAIGIPCKAIVDLDFAFNGAHTAKLIEKDNDAIKGCKEILKTLKEEGKIELNNDGLPKKHDGKSAAKGYELMAEDNNAKPHINSLSDKLLEHNIWLWKKGAIEKHLDLKEKTSSVCAEFLKNLEANQKFLEELNDRLNDDHNIKNLCEWIKEDA